MSIVAEGRSYQHDLISIFPAKLERNITKLVTKLLDMICGPPDFSHAWPGLLLIGAMRSQTPVLTELE